MKRNRISYLSSVKIPKPFFDSWLGPYRLPEFQRELVWTDEQNTRLIESIWYDIDIGSHTVNRSPVNDYAFDNMLLDGQQRINAISLYFKDKFPVFNRYFSETSPSDKMFFMQRKFTVRYTKFDNIQDMKDYYDLMNFGGTQHTPPSNTPSL